jgi:hypothetical protein
MTRTKALLLPTAAIIAVLGVLGATSACTADLSDSVIGGGQPPATPSASTSPDQRSVPGSVSGSDPTDCTTGYNSGEVSVDISMYNATDQTLTLDPGLSGHNGNNEHWGTQPPATLTPGQCARMSAYSDITDEPVGAHAIYEMPNGNFVVFAADSHNSRETSTVFTAEPILNWGSATWTGPQDPTYNIHQTTDTGNFHVHVALQLEGGATNSYNLTSSPMTLAQENDNYPASTPTYSAACSLGYHVRIDATTSKPMVTLNNVSGDTSSWTFKTLNAQSADGTVNGTTQYQGIGYALQTAAVKQATATISWTCDPSIWGTSGTAPTFLQDSPPATVPAQTPMNYRFTTLAFPAATYGLASGQLPTGTTLDPNGNLTGTPTTPGTYDFTIKASNDISNATTNQLTVTVQ